MTQGFRPRYLLASVLLLTALVTLLGDRLAEPGHTIPPPIVGGGRIPSPVRRDAL